MRNKKVKNLKDIKELTKKEINFPISVKFPIKGAGGILYWEDNYKPLENEMSRAYWYFLTGSNDILEKLKLPVEVKQKVLSDCKLVWSELVARDVKRLVPIDQYGKPIINTYGYGEKVCINKFREGRKKYWEKGRGGELDIEKEIINLIPAARQRDKEKALDYLANIRGDLQDDVFRCHIKPHPDSKRLDEIKDANELRRLEWEKQLSSGESYVRNQKMAEAGIEIQVDTENDIGPYQWLQSQDGYNYQKDEPDQNYINIRLLEEILPPAIFKLIMTFFAGQKIRFPRIQDLTRVDLEQNVYKTYKKFQERKKYWRTQKQGDGGSLLLDEKGEPIWETSIRGGVPHTIRDIANIYKTSHTTVSRIIKDFKHREAEAEKREEEYGQESAFLHSDTEKRLRWHLWALSRFTKALLRVDIIPWSDSSKEIARAKNEVEEKMKGVERVRGANLEELTKAEPHPKETEVEKTRPTIAFYKDQSTIDKFKKPRRRRKKDKDKGIWSGKVAEDKEAETNPEAEDEDAI